MKKTTFLLIFFASFFLPCLTVCLALDQGNLLDDLMIVEYWNRRINERLPVTFNNILQGGYINMPSARMGAEGEIGFGYSRVHPYVNYNLRCQILDRLEVSGSYRVFKGVDDPILTPLGFGDLSDKGVNVKLALFHPEESGYDLPGLSVGFDDFIGTQNFRSRYIVLTKVFLEHDAEVSIGYGAQRIRKWFGGMIWMPFRKSGCSYLKDFCLVAEYDATPYKDPEIEKHPKGRKSKTGWNGGIKYRLFDSIDLSLSYVRGHKWAFAASTYYNFGTTKGFLPKINDPLVYQAPVNYEPIGCKRPVEMLMQELVYAFRDQGFTILESWISYDECLEKLLRIKIYNRIFRSEREVRCRLNHLLASLIPGDIDRVTIVLESEGFPIQEYRYSMNTLRSYSLQEMAETELVILNPIAEASEADPCRETLIYKDRLPWFNFDLFPQTHTFFGSSRGKFKYSLGIGTKFDGFLPNNVYYSVELGYSLWSNLHHIKGVDRLNPSKLINVRTDIVNYYRQKGVTVNEAYLQKIWNLGSGFYSRGALGYLEVAYGGIAGQFLYYPVKSRWAIGIEGALFRKRSYEGLGFTDKIRKIESFHVKHKSFPFGSQYFLSLYYDWREMKVDFAVKAGKFLANDYGARFELSRNFDSGLRITLWYTYTNGNDHINGKVYHDKGIAFSAPLDWFYMNTSRDKWNYGMSAWLRDVGVMGGTGQDLYYLINDQR